jgi:arylsulfatase A-like enzyme
MTTRRAFLTTAAAGLAQTGRPPNVIVILADDLGWNDVGFHGSEIRTPNLDRLARGGLVLDRFYSQPLCSPTRTALMTGRSPMRSGVQYSVIRPWADYGVPLTESLMPESFRAAGYRTGMCGKWHLGHSRRAFLPHARGFDHAYGHVNGNIDYYTHEREGGLDWHRNGTSVREDGYSTDLIAAEAARFITSGDTRKPFFLYVAFNAPHAPLQAPAGRIARYVSIADQKRRTFAAMVEIMDEGVGRIMKTLEVQKIANDTIVLFFSDNGGPPGSGARNEPLRGTKGSTWEGGIRVPAVLSWPGRLKAASTNQVVSAIDVFPTLAAAAGVEPRNKLPLDGKSVWPQLSGGTTKPREPLFFAVDRNAKQMYAVLEGDWKLVRQDGDFLFRPAEDPDEKNDLAAENKEVVKRLGALLDEWARLHPPGGMRESSRPPAEWKAPPRWAEAALE